MALANRIQSNAFFSTTSDTDRDGNIVTYEFKVRASLSAARGVFKRNDRTGVVRDSQFTIDDQKEFATVIVAWSISYPSDVPASVSGIIQGWQAKLTEAGSTEADDLAAHYGRLVWPVKASYTEAVKKWLRENADDYPYPCLTDGTFWFADQKTAALFKMFWA